MMRIGGVDYWQPLLPQLDRLGIEMDQKLRQAWDACASGFVTEVHLLNALRTLGARGLECMPGRWRQRGLFRTGRGGTLRQPLPWPEDVCSPEHAEVAARFGFPIWERGLELVGNGKAITCHHLCRAIADTFLQPWQGPPADTPALVRYLGGYFREASSGEDAGGFTQIPDMLADMPRTRAVIEALGHVPPEPDDFEYAICLQGDQIVVRAVSVVRDSLLSVGDAYHPTRSLLTHFQRQFGAFTPDEIAELEDLIRNPRTTELDLQRFFERHPHFFRRWDHREVHPHVYLVRDGEGPLVPDFILTNPEVQQATVLELKLPKPMLVVHEDNRVRFSSAVMEARAQLLTYRDWFREKANRERLVARLGMEVLEPRLAVIIGRSSSFAPGVERQRLAADTPDVEIVTLDDIASYARQRLIAMGA